MKRTWLGAGLLLLSGACSDGGFRQVETEVQEVLRAVEFNNVGQILGVGAQGTVLLFDNDQGLVNTSTDGDPGPRLANFEAVSSGGERWVIAGAAGVALSFDGIEFTRIDARTDARIQSALGLTPTITYLGGEGGVLRRYRQRTERAEVEQTGDNNRIVALHGRSESEILAVTERGTLLERIDGDWSSSEVITETSSEALPLFDVWSATVGADVWAVGLGGRSFRRTAGEVTWDELDSGVPSDLYAIADSGIDRLYAVGAQGVVLRWVDGAWVRQRSTTGRDLYSVAVSANQVVAVGADGTFIVADE